MEILTIKHKDVKGKELLYLKIKNEYGEVLLNIGQKSFDNISELLNKKEVNNAKKVDKQ